MSNPTKMLLIMHDGTSALGLPHLSHRTIKNLDHHRFNVVPWLSIDYSSPGHRKDYIYSCKSSGAKDSNYLISQLHAIVRRAKSDYKNGRHHARKLVIIADSASENKNNVLFAYCTDLVDNGWFDEIQLLFGPVGHTHNGVDATHKIHNVDVGRYIAGDFGHFVRNFPYGFSGDPIGMPTANILKDTLDWKEYYRPHLRTMSGFTNTPADPIGVRGFRVAKSIHGGTELTWKVDPALEKDWRGTGGFPNTAGHYMLTSAPVGLPPKVIIPEADAAQIANARLLTSKNWEHALAPEGLLPCMEWCFQAETAGVIPIHKYLEADTPPGEIGRKAEVGAIADKRGIVRVLEDYWDPKQPQVRAALWTLPEGTNGEHKAATSNAFHFSGDQGIIDARRLPTVRYGNEKAHNCEVATHPNNLPKEGGGEGWTDQRDPEDEDEVKEEEEGDGADRTWRFEVDITGMIVGNEAIVYATTINGPSPYLCIGEIKAIDKGKKNFTMYKYIPTKDPWTPECITTKWHVPVRTTQRSATEDFPHHAVILYSKALFTAGKKLNAKAKAAVKSRKIVWCKTSDTDMEGEA